MTVRNVEQHPVVVVAPAMAVGSRYYRPLVESFREHGWEAVVLPRRGFEDGDPRASRRHDWSYQDEIDVIAGTIAAQRRQAPRRPVILLGHSLGGQMAAGHELNHLPADGLVAVGASLPYHRTYPWGGPHVLAMGAVVVPVLTRLFGYLPKPAFGGPGARTLMREWAHMAVTGQPPFTVDGVIGTPSLHVSLARDVYAPQSSVGHYVDRLFDPRQVTRWHYCDEEAVDGASNDHTGWVRTPAPVVERVVAWWEHVNGDDQAEGAPVLTAGGLADELPGSP